MNLTRKVSTTTYPIVFMMVDATDHITGETGLTPTVTISKNGASFGAVSGSVTELGGGLYSLAGNATDRNTLGELWIHAEAAGADNVDLKVDIVSHDPYGDIAEILTDTGTTIPGLLDAIKGAGWADETLVALMTAVESGAVDEATIRTAIGLATANLDTQLAATKTVVDGIVADMASVDDITTPLSVVDDIVDAIKLKTDLIPASPAEAGEYTAAIAAVQAELDNPDQYKADVSGLALESTLTAIKGAGWSTETLAAIKSAIDALSSGGVDPAVIAAAILDALLADHTVAGSVAKTIADILEDTGTTLSNLITAIKSKTDLMDASAITYTPNVVGTDITLLRGDTFSATLTDVGALTGYVSIDFTVKRNTSNTDDEAVIRIRKNASGTGDGLLRLNRAAPTTETGEIVIDDEATGDITITLDETATDSLEIGAYLYDVQLITATAVKTLTSGRLNVTSDVTRAIA